MFFVVKRATLLMASGPANDIGRKHLFICVTDAVGAAKETLIVPIQSHRANITNDGACVLHVGDHPFIKHKSVVSYRDAKIVEEAKLMNGVKAGLFVPREAIDTAVFARVCYGLEQSQFVAPKFLAFYNASRGIQP